VGEKLSVLSVAVPSVFLEGLDYLLPEGADLTQATPGVRVRVPLGRREVTGVVLSLKSNSSYDRKKLRRAIAFLDEEPLLSDELLLLYSWVSRYYHFPIGEVILGTLPSKLRQPKPAILKKQPALVPLHFEPIVALNQEQKQAVEQLQQVQGYRCFLLDGVTGSGKTEVYMHAIVQALKKQQQVLVLVPEIALTPQTLARFEQRFSVPVIAYHSALTPAVRLQHWLLCRADVPLIVIGTRSSVFAPFSRLGLIVIDEEHDASYKQQTGLRYSARDVAIKRASDCGIPIILGSATPSLESYHNAVEGRFGHLKLSERVGGGRMPEVELIDLRGQHCDSGLSPRLLELISAEVERGNQVLLFLNRRGFAPVMMCHHCGWVVRCHHCESNLVWHKHRQRLVCHHCDLRRQVPMCCAQCEQANLIPVGLGTEQLEESLTTQFAPVPVIRIDRDSTRRKNSLEDKLQRLESGEPVILVGTQMLTKGHHFSKLTLVGMIEADSGLMGVDFRARERFAQQLVQVSGRAGRGNQVGRVVIQTRQPDDVFLNQLLKLGYHGGLSGSLVQRRQLGYPPYGYLALLQADDPQAHKPNDFLRQVFRMLDSFGGDVELLGPVPAPMEKLRGRYRAQLLIKSNHRKSLHDLLYWFSRQVKEIKLSRTVRWSVDVDPQVMT
jgi:primosomal protein N' (replication factor Y)